MSDFYGQSEELTTRGSDWGNASPTCRRKGYWAEIGAIGTACTFVVARNLPELCSRL
jgi:hypothetical protein